jgi:hypothetical protein
VVVVFVQVRDAQDLESWIMDILYLYCPVKIVQCILNNGFMFLRLL